MKRKQITMIAFLLILTLLFPALADSLPLGENISDVFVLPYEDGEGTYTYSYSYPYILETNEASDSINLFYQNEISYAQEFRIPMDLEYNSTTGLDSGTEISSVVTCNNDEYFSVLVRKHVIMDGENMETWQGNVFSLKNIKPGTCVSLPYLLGILTTDDNDTWLQDRQTEKANTLVRDMIYDKMIHDSETDSVSFFPDFNRNLLDDLFYPEEDFYLDEQGEPVFFIQPGYAADESYGVLIYSLKLEDILDEL